MKKKLIRSLILMSIGCMIGIHRKAIMAYITGSEMPKAPVWHWWVKK